MLPSIQTRELQAEILMALSVHFGFFLYAVRIEAVDLYRTGFSFQVWRLELGCVKGVIATGYRD